MALKKSNVPIKSALSSHKIIESVVSFIASIAKKISLEIHIKEYSIKLTFENGLILTISILAKDKKTALLHLDEISKISPIKYHEFI